MPTFTALIPADASSSTASSYVTASVAPAANRLVLVGVSSTRSDGAELSTITGLGLTWTRVDGGPVGSSPTRTGSIWMAETGGSAPTPGALTLGYASPPTAVIWAVVEVEGYDPADPIAQSKVATGLSVTTITATFDATPDAGSGIFSITGVNLQEAINPGTGYTELAEDSIGGPNGTLQAQARTDGAATASTSWTTASNAVMVAVEVAAAGGGGEDPGEGTASGSWSFTGTASGVHTPKGSASGTFAYTGTASGAREPKATATGATAWVGEATGTAPSVDGAEGTAAGSWSFTGTATGTTDRSGTATGSTTWTGAAVGDAPSVDGAEGTAAGTWAYVGTATGTRTPKGTSTGTWTWTGTAAGTTTRTGAGGGTVAWVGTALGGDLRDVTVLSVTEHQRQVTVTEHARAVEITEHQRVVTIEGEAMQLPREGREFYVLEIATDPTVTGWEAHFGETDEAGDKVWVAGTVGGDNVRWLLAGPDAELDAAVAVIEASVEPSIRVIDNREIIVRDAPAVYLV